MLDYEIVYDESDFQKFNVGDKVRYINYLSSKNTYTIVEIRNNIYYFIHNYNKFRYSETIERGDKKLELIKRG